MSGAQPDEEVAVTKRGRAVKLPAKYKAEVSCHTSLLFFDNLYSVATLFFHCTSLSLHRVHAFTMSVLNRLCTGCGAWTSGFLEFVHPVGPKLLPSNYGL